MQDPEIIKAFCGGDNDFLRMRKDWNVFPLATVDVQQMWLNWKISNQEECFEASRTAIKILMVEKRGKKKTPQLEPSEFEIREYFHSMEKIGFATLCQIFSPHFRKSGFATLADWTVRPLHPNLLKYAAEDSSYLWKLFYLLLNKVIITWSLKLERRN